MRPLPALFLALALAAGPLAAQEVASGDAAPDAPGAAADLDAQVATDAQAPDALAEAADPVARWQADPLAALDGAEVDLDAFLYVARPFVVFAESPLQPQLAEQLRLLQADAEGLAARDVAVIVDSDPEGASALRRELRPRGFGVVLLDKDGRVTLRRPAPLPAREVARAIDRTPLRQEELRLQRP